MKKITWLSLWLSLFISPFTFAHDGHGFHHGGRQHGVLRGRRLHARPRTEFDARYRLGARF